MRTITVMATAALYEDVVFGQYELAPQQIVSMRQLEPRRIRISEDDFTTIYSPIVEITTTGGTLYASGVVQEILARCR